MEKVEVVKGSKHTMTAHTAGNAQPKITAGSSRGQQMHPIGHLVTTRQKQDIAWKQPTQECGGQSVGSAKEERSDKKKNEKNRKHLKKLGFLKVKKGGRKIEKIKNKLVM